MCHGKAKGGFVANAHMHSLVSCSVCVWCRGSGLGWDLKEMVKVQGEGWGGGGALSQGGRWTQGGVGYQGGQMGAIFGGSPVYGQFRYCLSMSVLLGFCPFQPLFSAAGLHFDYFGHVGPFLPVSVNFWPLLPLSPISTLRDWAPAWPA